MSTSDAGAGWPALTYESLPWESDPSAVASRSAWRRHRGPYDAAVVPDIAGLDVALAPQVRSDAEDAANEIARFDAELGDEIAPFSAVLLRTESAASSKIENLTASARAIAEAELSGRGGLNATLIVANERAMTAAISLAEQIDGAAILSMHAALMEGSQPEIAGRWREEQVWIGGSDLGPHQADFVPPHHGRVEDAIADLVAFIDRDDIGVLAHAAIAHAQFETIHPFPDGNGRTGRALVHAQLRHQRLTRNVTVPVSAGLLADIDNYFAALTAYRSGDLEPIVAEFSAAAFRATENGRRLVQDLHSIRSEWSEQIVARRDAAAWKVADLLLRHPVVDATLIANATGSAVQNVYRSIAPLVEAGVLVEFTDRRRNRAWRAPVVLDALDRFAARAGRRRRPSGSS